MKLAELVKTLDFPIEPGERWAVLGPEAGAFRLRLPAGERLDAVRPDLDGLLLAGLLSDVAGPWSWLEQTLSILRPGASLAVIDWQYETSGDAGPELERRIRGGKVCRWLREAGFGLVEKQGGHPYYYLVWAVKGPAPPIVHAGEFVAVATLEELPKNAMKPLVLFGHSIIVANTGKEIVAFARACPHAHHPLDRGLLRGRNLVCRSHAYMWDICSGEPVEPAGEDILARYPVKIDREQGQILVALAQNPHQIS